MSTSSGTLGKLAIFAVLAGVFVYIVHARSGRPYPKGEVRGGERVEMKDPIEPGKTNIVCFCADW